MNKDNRGNPNIKNFGYKTDREEPLNKMLAVKVTETMFNKVKSLPNSAEFMRQAIQEALDKLEKQ
ncbi:hypothetical protein [Fischerella thermalis]|uniref:Uncharacterized protein n=1 Tax=Fischerella thermalis CCMEE 5318 TaxID=2019666 RepID=A0A2N6LI00_9CYAN|nr:hypothetical protein [Fischerella thermalis]PMB18652.1 hypothetical protein CEN47_24105 [Fischerella thermalis CCMEE 5319]PMB23792.1 hypothetical protein CEN46_09520 [Fischerella thermalis CCMEE 5318]